MPRLCELYPGICFTTEEKARKNLRQGKKNLRQGKKNLIQSIICMNRVIDYCFYVFVYLQTNTTNTVLYVVYVQWNMFWCVV